MYVYIYLRMFLSMWNMYAQNDLYLGIFSNYMYIYIYIWNMYDQNDVYVGAFTNYEYISMYLCFHMEYVCSE